MSLENVRYKFGRIISENVDLPKKLNRGIETHGRIGKFFANQFGSGTLKVKVNDRDFYLNRGSCFKFIEKA